MCISYSYHNKATTEPIVQDCPYTGEYRVLRSWMLLAGSYAPDNTHTCALTSKPPATHNVQDVVITYYENSLSVKCVYLEGVTRSCYIVAIQDGVVIYNNTISHLTSLDIPGNFTLKVFDSAEQREPAIVQNVTRPIHVPGKCL